MEGRERERERERSRGRREGKGGRSSREGEVFLR